MFSGLLGQAKEQVSRATDAALAWGQRNIAEPVQQVGEATNRALEDIPRVFTEPLDKGEGIPDPYTRFLVRAGESVKRPLRLAQDILTPLTAPFAMPGAKQVIEPPLTLATNLVKATSPTMRIRPDLRERGAVEILSTPGGVTTGNPEIDIALENAVPIVAFGGGERAGRAAIPEPSFKPILGQGQRLTVPPPTEEAPAAPPVRQPLITPARPGSILGTQRLLPPAGVPEEAEFLAGKPSAMPRLPFLRNIGVVEDVGPGVRSPQAAARPVVVDASEVSAAPPIRLPFLPEPQLRFRQAEPSQAAAITDPLLAEKARLESEIRANQGSIEAVTLSNRLREVDRAIASRPAPREVFVRPESVRPIGTSKEPLPPLVPEEHADLERQAGRRLTTEEAQRLRVSGMLARSAETPPSRAIEEIREPARERIEATSQQRQQAQLAANRLRNPVEREYAQSYVAARVEGKPAPEPIGTLRAARAAQIRASLEDYLSRQQPQPVRERFDPDVVAEAESAMRGALDLLGPA